MNLIMRIKTDDYNNKILQQPRQRRRCTDKLMYTTIAHVAAVAMAFTCLARFCVFHQFCKLFEHVIFTKFTLLLSFERVLKREKKTINKRKGTLISVERSWCGLN